MLAMDSTEAMTVQEIHMSFKIVNGIVCTRVLYARESAVTNPIDVFPYRKTWLCTSVKQQILEIFRLCQMRQPRQDAVPKQRRSLGVVKALVFLILHTLEGSTRMSWSFPLLHTFDVTNQKKMDGSVS